ncbi:MAG: xylulose kinase [Bacteroidia bacterium]|nr:xylulose kinase [Bacteroidia bacterium]
MSQNPLILTIDLGTGGPKAALFTAAGELVGHAFAETPIQLLPGGGAEQDPADWWRAIKSAIQQLLSQVRVDPASIVAMNVTAQWSGTVAVDKEGNPLMNAVIWMDSRGSKQIKELVKGPLMVEGYAVNKILGWLRKTGGAPGHAGKDPLAHILFIKANYPEVYAKTHKFLEPKDYLNLKLTGIFAASYDSITLHWVTDNRKINEVRYDEGLLKMSTLDRAKLPDLNPPNQVLGTLTAEVARELGLSPDTKVISGTPDLQSAAVGSGAVLDFQPHLYVGTSSWLVCHVPWKKTDIDHNMASLPAAIPGRYFIVNEQETAGECLDFFKDNILYPRDALSQEEAPADFFRRINELAASVPAGSNRLIFMPWLYGERSPIEDHYVRGGFFNMGLDHTRAHLVRAIMEGVACNSRWLLRYVEKMCKRQFEAINFIGGGAQSEIWCQIFADVFDRPIRQVEDPILANARGAAFLASMALGLLKLEDIPQKIKIRKTFTPNPQNHQVYDNLFREYVQIYKRNKKAYKRLNSHS